jgi:hypothetical protein
MSFKRKSMPAGTIPTLIGPSPTTVGTLATVIGTLPTTVGTLPMTVGNSPTIVGTLATIVGKAPKTIKNVLLQYKSSKIVAVLVLIPNAFFQFIHFIKHRFQFFFSCFISKQFFQNSRELTF